MSPLKLFRIVAVAEACSWIGLLIGMYLKRVSETTDVGVQVMGPIHGTAFLAFVVVTLSIGGRAGWRPKHFVLGLGSSIPPLATLWFERYAERHDLIPASWDAPEAASS